MIGIGLDTVDIARFREVLVRRPRLIERVFTASEREECERRAALGVGIGAIAFRDVEVVRTSTGAPSLATTGQAALLVAKAGIDRLDVSLTHSGLVASAIVVAT
jgi:holo-[acyl-carrier protein] synthase